jgi:hypothetical protein
MDARYVARRLGRDATISRTLHARRAAAAPRGLPQGTHTVSGPSHPHDLTSYAQALMTQGKSSGPYTDERCRSLAQELVDSSPTAPFDDPANADEPPSIILGYDVFPRACALQYVPAHRRPAPRPHLRQRPRAPGRDSSRRCSTRHRPVRLLRPHAGRLRALSASGRRRPRGRRAPCRFELRVLHSLTLAVLTPPQTHSSTRSTTSLTSSRLHRCARRCRSPRACAPRPRSACRCGPRRRSSAPGSTRTSHSCSRGTRRCGRRSRTSTSRWTRA